jgi:hypothetical protein
LTLADARAVSAVVVRQARGAITSAGGTVAARGRRGSRRHVQTVDWAVKVAIEASLVPRARGASAISLVAGHVETAVAVIVAVSAPLARWALRAGTIAIDTGAAKASRRGRVAASRAEELTLVAGLVERAGRALASACNRIVVAIVVSIKVAAHTILSTVRAILVRGAGSAVAITRGAVAALCAVGAAHLRAVEAVAGGRIAVVAIARAGDALETSVGRPASAS